MDLELQGKTIIVTGGASNIGRAITMAFIKEGSNVIMAEIDDELGVKVEKIANDLNTGGCCKFIKTDVTDYAQVEEMARKAKENFGKIDVLIHVWSLLNI